MLTRRYILNFPNISEQIDKSSSPSKPQLGISFGTSRQFAHGPRIHCPVAGVATGTLSLLRRGTLQYQAHSVVGRDRPCQRQPLKALREARSCRISNASKQSQQALTNAILPNCPLRPSSLSQTPKVRKKLPPWSLQRRKSQV